MSACGHRQCVRLYSTSIVRYALRMHITLQHTARSGAVSGLSLPVVCMLEAFKACIPEGTSPCLHDSRQLRPGAERRPAYARVGLMVLITVTDGKL